ncbi:MAG: hypothetical protein ACR2RB_02685 [Gammaproteobacteria bacterium]
MFLTLVACAEIPVQSPHLNIHKDGYVSNDSGKAIERPAKRHGETAEERVVKKLIDTISAQVAHDCSANGTGSSHLMLFVHGGLTSTRGALKSSAELDRERVFESRGIRPIYINWNSSLFSSLGDDVFWVRRGVRSPEGAVLAPAVVAWRLASGVFNTVPNLYYQLQDEGRFAQRWPMEDPTFGDKLSDGVVGIVHAPFSIVSTPFFTGFGRGAWDMMKRRIDMMFAVQKAPRRFFKWRRDNKPGVMRTFLGALRKKRDDWARQCNESFELDFVGHSMGALIGTRILREYPELKFDRVVFLAPASTAEDFVTTVPVYLDRHVNSKFYSYALSVIDEANELTLKSFIFPRGSLLIWVDNFFDPILSPEDYRVGDSFNVPIFKVARQSGPGSTCERMRLVNFARRKIDREGWPRKHGDLNDARYLGRLLDLTIKQARELQGACENCAVYDPCRDCFLTPRDECQPPREAAKPD